MAKLNIDPTLLEKYLDQIAEDYAIWWGDRANDKTVLEMIEEFNKDISFIVGSRYIKVVTKRSVHSFIVNSTKAKFPLGSILKAASWASPATNFARGNILDKQDRFPITWTGTR